MPKSADTATFDVAPVAKGADTGSPLKAAAIDLARVSAKEESITKLPPTTGAGPPPLPLAVFPPEDPPVS